MNTFKLKIVYIFMTFQIFLFLSIYFLVVFKLVNIVKFSDVYGFFVFSRQTNYIVILTQLQLTHNKCHMVFKKCHT